MLGRGLMACPDLALQIKAAAAAEDYQPLSWAAVCQHLYHYHTATRDVYPSKFLGNRVKQWLVYLRRQYAEATEFFEQIKRHRDPASLEAAFAYYGASADG